MWLASKDCHRAETMTGYQAQRLYQIFQQRDNDIFVRLHYNGGARLQSKLQFSFLDPSQIRGDAFTSSGGFNADDSDGIVRDNAGREMQYKVWLKEKGSPSQFKEVTIPARGSKSGRRMMLHGFSPEYASQGRGYSRLAHALQEFQNLTDFSLATIKKAINQSNITMYVKPSPDNAASNPLEDLRGPAGPASTQFGSDPEGMGARQLHPSGLFRHHPQNRFGQWLVLVGIHPHSPAWLCIVRHVARSKLGPSTQ